MEQEFDFSINSFQKQKEYTGPMAYAIRIKNLFLMKPGQFPSIPEMGLDIPSIRYQFMDTLLAGELRNKIMNQISAYTDIQVSDVTISTMTVGDKGDVVLLIDVILTTAAKTITYAVLQKPSGTVVNFDFKIYDSETVKIK